MHIVYVIAPYGGPEAYVKTLLPYWTSRNHKVSVVYVRQRKEPSPLASATVRIYYALSGSLHYYVSRLVGNYRAWPKRLQTWEIGQAVYKVLRRIQADLPVDVVEIPEGIPVEPLKDHWPIVLRPHGAAWTFRHFCQDGDRRYDQLIIKVARRHLEVAHAVSPISAHLADHLSEFCGVSIEKIDAIPYPIDVEQFRQGKGDLNHEGPMLMSVGRLEHRKGTDTLLHAMRQVWQHVPKASLYFLGGEAQFTQAQLQQMVPQDKQPQVIFPGFVQHDHLLNYYGATTIYLAPTQYETFGYTILEAMACGCPVIASRVGAVPELVEDGKTGLLVPFGDTEALAKAIVYLLSQPELRAQMSLAARHKALSYSRDKIGGDLENLYQQAVANALLGKKQKTVGISRLFSW